MSQKPTCWSRTGRYRRHRKSRASKSRERDAGFGLVDFVIAATVLSVGIGAIGVTLATTVSMRKTVRETRLATNAAQSVVESIQGETFAEVFARFNHNPKDDPANGRSPGARFAVTGLNLRPGDADGSVGEVEFPVIGTALREDVVNAELGMPRDLNGDGKIDDQDHSGDYVVLPFRVRVEWTGATGERVSELTSTAAKIGGAN